MKRDVTQSARAKTAGRPRGGVFAPHKKNTAENESVIMPVPSRVAIIMQQHIGTPCTPLVKKGDTVLVGQKIADSEKPVSAPIHSSVSGVVAEISNIMLPSGKTTQTIVIDTDGEQKPYPDIAPPVIENLEDLITAVRESGLVGLGGAGFPTHIKLSTKQPVDTLIINAAECEPYITSDYREIIENADDIMDGVYLLLKHINLKKVIIVIENKKPKYIDLITILEYDNRDIDDRVQVLKVKSKYPRGAEKVTVYAATGRKIPAGKLPADVGCIVMNVSSVASIGKYSKTGMPLVSRRITVDGSSIKNSMNVIVPVGAYISDVIEFTGGYKKAPKKILMGGPMMGVSIPSDDMPIMKQNNAILAFSKTEAYPKDVSNCIRCGRCVAVCPMSLMPTKVESHLKVMDIDYLKNDDVLSCIECGCCAFACPASRPLVQAMRQAKSVVKR